MHRVCRISTKPKAPPVCSMCHRTFKSKGNLKNHLRVCQSVFETAKCPGCGKTFQRSATTTIGESWSGIFFLLMCPDQTRKWMWVIPTSARAVINISSTTRYSLNIKHTPNANLKSLTVQSASSIFLTDLGLAGTSVTNSICNSESGKIYES